MCYMCGIRVDILFDVKGIGARAGNDYSLITLLISYNIIVML